MSDPTMPTERKSTLTREITENRRRKPCSVRNDSHVERIIAAGLKQMCFHNSIFEKRMGNSQIGRDTRWFLRILQQQWNSDELPEAAKSRGIASYRQKYGSPLDLHVIRWPEHWNRPSYAVFEATQYICFEGQIFIGHFRHLGCDVSARWQGA